MRDIHVFISDNVKIGTIIKIINLETEEYIKKYKNRKLIWQS